MRATIVLLGVVLMVAVSPALAVAQAGSSAGSTDGPASQALMTSDGTAALADPGALVVNETGSNGAYTSLQTAITAASPGDTIQVYPGTYSEATVDVAKPGLTIVGIPGDDTPGAAATAPTIQGFWEISEAADDLTIRGLDITGAVRTNPVIGQGGGDRDLTGFTFEQNTLRSTGYLQLKISHQSSAALSDIDVSGNHFDGSTLSIYGYRGPFLEQSPTYSYENIVVANNNFERGGGEAQFFFDSRYGDTTTVAITDNRFVNPAEDGTAVWYGFGSTETTAELDFSRNLVQGFGGSSHAAVIIESDRRPSAFTPTMTISHNRIVDNTLGVSVFELDPTGTVATQNVIADNSLIGLMYIGDPGKITSGEYFDARDNYWGHESGPSTYGTEVTITDPVTGVAADGAGDAIGLFGRPEVGRLPSPTDAGIYTPLVATEDDLVIEQLVREPVIERLSNTFMRFDPVATSIDFSVPGKKKPKTEQPFRVTDWSVDRTQIRAGERIQLTVSFVNEWEGTETWKGASASFIGQVVPPVDIAAGERVTKTFEFTIPESGTYNLRVDRGGVVSIFVAPASDPSVEVYTGNRNDSEQVVTARNLAGGVPAYVLLEPTPNGVVSGVHVNRLGVNTTWLTDYDLTFRQYNRLRGDMQPLPTGALALSLFNVTHTMYPEDVESATIQFTIENGTLASMLGTGASPGDVALYRYNHSTNAWDRIPATDVAFLGRTDTGAYRFEATVPSFSHYAVAGLSHSFTVSDTGLNVTAVTTGDAVGVVANVTNDGQANGTEKVPLFVGETFVDSLEVTLAPNETRSIRFTHVPTEAGLFNLSVADAAAGTLNVTSATTPTPPTTTAPPTTAQPTTTDAPPTTTSPPTTATPTTAPTTAAPTTTTTGSGGPGFGTLVALLALIGVAILAMRRA